MAPSKVAVCGATGAQGGAVVTALLAAGVKVRGLTRKLDSPAAKALEARGVEVATADFDKPETLVAAFQGCDAAYVVTNFWEHLDPAKEISQATAAADAAAAAGVKHVVWSSLEDSRKVLGDDVPSVGAYKVPHFDCKDEATHIMRGKGHPVTDMITSVYMDNMLTYFKPHPVGEGKYAVTVPATLGKPVAWVSVEDIGNTAAALLVQGPEKWAGKTACAVGDLVSFKDVVAAIAEATGKPIALNEVGDVEYKAMLQGFGMSEVAAQDMLNMFSYYREPSGTMVALRSVEANRELVPGLKSVKQWVASKKDAFLAGMQ